LSRNNQSRLQAPQPAFSVDPVSAMPQTHISISVPSEFVELPSRGMFYPPSHPLHRKPSIEIKHMTAKEEDILTSEALIKKGLVLDRLIQSVILDKNIDPSSLLVCDRNAILIAIRITGYGPEYEATATCPACGHKHDINYDLEQIESTEYVKPEDVHFSDRGSCIVKLPKSGDTIEFRLLTGYDEKEVLNIDKTSVASTLVTDQLKSLILTINGNEDIAFINAYVTGMSAFDSRYLRKAIKSSTPNVDLKYSLSCNKCNTQSVVEVPIGIKFFWPDA
jgi:transcription elongation factor Elf1